MIDLETNFLKQCMTGNVDELRLILQKIENMAERKIVMNAKDEKNRSGLLLSIINGHTIVAGFLIEQGVDVNLASNSRNNEREGQTSLIVASLYGYTDIVQLLINSGVRVDARCKDKTGAACCAAEKGHIDVLKILLSHNKKLADEKGYCGRTPLATASRHGHMEIVKYLINEFNSKIDAQDNDRQTPLMLAASSNHASVVSFLLENGANYSTKGLNKKTALEQATFNNHQSIVKIINDLEN